MNGRAMVGKAYIPTDVEHIANVITHGLWIVPSLLGLYWLLSLADTMSERYIVLVYGFAVLALFTVSTIFHTISYIGRFSTLKNIFHIGDRAVIYLFIAASYTPWLALKNMESWGKAMLFIVWLMAIFGIWYQYTFHERYKWLETVFYLIIGIFPAISIFAMHETSGMYEVACGGIVYVAGVVFFKCDGLIPFAHAIWHCFVIVGALCHYFAICNYLLMNPIDSKKVLLPT